MIPTLVSAVTDPRLDPFRSLKGQSSRDDGTFVAESEIVLERLFASGIVIRSVLITPARAERLSEMLSSSVASSIERGTSPDIHVFVAEQKIIDQVVGYPLHRGVISLAERPALPSVDALLAGARTVILLEGVMDPDNVGSVFRHAAGFGVDGIILRGHTGDPLYRKTIRTSMGWTLSIPFARSAPGEPPLTELFRSQGFTTFALTPARSAERLSDVLSRLDETARIAFLLGAEGPGLTEEAMASADHRVRIPLSDGVDSLNIATSAAIALYALADAQPARLRSREGM